jgi:hypothetical protein
MIASRVSGSATVVVEAKTRMCVVRASSRPPPNAGAASAEMVGIESCDIDVRVPRNVDRKFAVLFQLSALFSARWVQASHSSDVNVALSLRSAPAQKLESASLARIRALVAPVSPSSCILFTWWFSSDSSCRDIALRAAGRLSERIRMLPLWGAGTFVTLRTGEGAVEYA